MWMYWLNIQGTKSVSSVVWTGCGRTEKKPGIKKGIFFFRLGVGSQQKIRNKLL